ncbi:MAG: Bile acid transporter [Microgenomates group bacterium GW2011_GWA2_40_6]|nr:MAG: Bile acid transporter [Microgenomates group bacterium GW2011_GWA2_40_6]
MRLSKYSGAVILLGAFFAFILPAPGLFLRPFLDYLLMFLIFLSCLDINLKEVLLSLRQYPKLIGILLIVHLFSPLIIFLFLKNFFSPEIYLGLILVASVPVGRSAVFLSNLFGGQPEKALVISTISNILSPLLVPLIVYLLAGSTISFDVTSMAKSMAIIVIVPFLLALLLQNHRLISPIKKIQTDISTILVALIVWGIIAPIRLQVLNEIQLSLGLTLISLFLMGLNFFLGFFIGKGHPEKITYGISAAYKNYSLATIVAATSFPSQVLVALPSLVYSVSNNILLLPMQFLLKSKHEPSNHRRPHPSHSHH